MTNPPVLLTVVPLMLTVLLTVALMSGTACCMFCSLRINDTCCRGRGRALLLVVGVTVVGMIPRGVGVCWYWQAVLV